MRPVLRYHGGKKILAPWIISQMAPHRFYIETHGGAASVLLNKPRAYAEVYNDIEEEVVNLFSCLREPTMAAKLVHQVELTPFSRQEFKRAYEKAADPVEQARRTIVRSFQGFGANGTNGIATGFRSNTKRSGTTPATDWRRYPAAMVKIIERLQGVIIENDDAINIIKKYDDTDALFYVDPPYVHATRSLDKSRGYKKEYTDDDHRTLAQVLNQVKGMVLVSGYNSVLYQELYKSWHMVSKASYKDGRTASVECIWMNNANFSRIQKQLF